MQRLFFIRLFIYFAAVGIPLFYPGVAVSYDSGSFFAIFLLLPLMQILAYYLRPPRIKFQYGALISLGTLVLYYNMAPIHDFRLIYSLLGASTYAITTLLFSGWKGGGALASLEIFVPAAIFYRLLNFSRASEDAFRESAEWISPVFALSVAIFLLHSAVLYQIVYKNGQKDPGTTLRKRAAASLLPASFAIGLGLLAYALPADFIKHQIVPNHFFEEPKPEHLNGGNDTDQKDEKGKNGGGLPLGERKFPSPAQELGSVGENEIYEKYGHDGKPSGSRLRGLASEHWNRQSGEGGGGQRAVMVIASPIDPLYSAESYWNDFDPNRGFYSDENDGLNTLRDARLLESWKNIDLPVDQKRKKYEIFYLSSIPERVAPYVPASIEPTKQDITYNPFSLSYRASANISMSGPDDWGKIKGTISSGEKRELSRYLDIRLKKPERDIYEQQLKKAIRGNQNYFEKIEGILKSLSDHQYELGFDEDTRPERLVRFLTETKRGDCTEFSHTAAILGRMAGIPSRVVTGYIATKMLQTPAHRRGIRILWEQIDILQNFPIETLYLITTSHHHSWVQYYLPGLGWVDFESTAFAIPPEPGGDPNSMDVVIPMIEREAAQKAAALKKKFPWRAVLEVLGGLVFLSILCLYLYRYLIEIYLRVVSRGNEKHSLLARYRILQMRLAAEGFPIRRPDETPADYAKRVPAISKFAEIHNELLFREIYGENEKENLLSLHRGEYRNIMRESRQKGAVGTIKRLFSLRGLYC